ncbi:MAG TPA: hypothetical protein DDX14_05550, partial [Cyanobacteria bacterium UBA9579]|nr:hypothetical protein [Cyanobacteria bacterium UBA9579]
MAIINGSPTEYDLFGTPDNDTIYGLDHDEYINGNEGDDVIYAAGGDDTINTGGINDQVNSGIDTLYGGIGNDEYFVWNTQAVVIENANEGVDTIEFRTNDPTHNNYTYVLPDNVEKLKLSSSIAINLNGTGNALNNTIYGDFYNNILRGEDGNDGLYGYDGDDTLYGGSGNDGMNGGNGNDVYYVDSSSDYISEIDNYGNITTGIDIVYSTASTYSLSSNIEYLILIGSENINANGNSQSNSITGNTGNNTIQSLAGDDTIDAGEGNDTLYGYTGNDTYIFNTGDGQDVISDESGTDTVSFGAGILSTDVSFVMSGYNLKAEFANSIDSITFTSWFSSPVYKIENFQFSNGTIITVNDIDSVLLNGTTSNDTLIGTDANNNFYGNTGADSMVGGAGNDSYFVDNTGDIVVENSNEGIDIIFTTVDYTLPENVENITLVSTYRTITGNALDNTITASSGGCTLSGGAGNDTYVINATSNSFSSIRTLSETSGTDIIRFGETLIRENILFTKSNNDLIITFTDRDYDRINIQNWFVNESYKIEQFEFSDGSTLTNSEISIRQPQTGTEGNDSITGTDYIDYIIGQAGDDVINGGLGVDTMVGGTGNDSYYIDNTSDVITENWDEGTDTVYFNVTYTTHISYMENYILLDSGGDINLYGNGYGNILQGNNYNNYIMADWGNDTVYGNGGNDSIKGGYSDDYIEGGAGNDTLLGEADNDTLIGGAGTDSLVGGTGNDVYYIDADDVIVENVNEGIDTVNSEINYTLGDNLENLILTGPSAANASGNALDNIITGNNINNVLNGGAGNDTLIGGIGNDTMIGGLGNDTYYVDSAYDSVIENANEGIDTVYSEVDYNLSINIENLTLTGVSAANASGNALDNIITGNDISNILNGGAGNDTLNGGSGADTLNGGTGNDSLIGGVGNDTYYIDANGDTVVENLNEGADTVYSSINYTLSDNFENLILTGSITNGTGNGLNNSITGNSANNILDGKAGTDTLIGGAGNDTYYVDNAGDVVTENTNEGTDTVQARSSYTLSANIENLTLLGSQTQSLTLQSGTEVIVYGDPLEWGNYLDYYQGDNTREFSSDCGIVSSENVLIQTGFLDLKLNYQPGSGKIDNLESELVDYAVENSLCITSNPDPYYNGGMYNTDIEILLEGQGASASIYDVSLDTLAQYVKDNKGIIAAVDADILWGLSDTFDALDHAITVTGVAYNTTNPSSIEGFYICDSGSWPLYNGAPNDVARFVSYDLMNTAFYYGDNVGNIIVIDDPLKQYFDNINGTGNALNNIITGNYGDNILNGGAGADTMYGKYGDDTYYVDNVGDVVIENIDEGIDTVNSEIDYALSINIENLTLTGLLAVNASGNALDNTITGNNIANILNGGAGNDVLHGYDGDDILDGGVGVDALYGGNGNDIYYVNGTVLYDFASEYNSTGIDLVYSSAQEWYLGQNFENLTLIGSANINGAGNELDNIITGNTGNNILIGEAGNDTIYGNVGNDSLTGNGGNDFLDGGIGNDNIIDHNGSDTIYGGDANDTIYNLYGYDFIEGGAGD